MADVLNCKHCGGKILVTGYCSQCGLKSEFVNKALNTSKYYYNIGLDKAVVAKSDISRNKHIYGDVFEAFIGAMFLDQGFVNTKRFIEKFIFPNFFDIKDLVTIDTNYKSRLIEWGQKNKVDIHFQTDEVARGRRKFCCTVMLSEEEKGKGEGTSKKEAEQNAAKIVIDILSKEADGNIEI